MATIFDNLKQAGQNAIAWLRQNAAKLSSVTPTELMRDADNKTNNNNITSHYVSQPTLSSLCHTLCGSHLQL